MQRLTVILLGVIGVVVLSAVLLSACRRQTVVVAERPWGSGYETSAGYMQPDHGWFYYYMMNRMFWQDTRPSYHIYAPPAGYAPTYRPWYHDDVRYRVSTPAPPSAATPARTSGGFVPASSVPTRRSGGFAPAPQVPTRTSGGFAPAPSAKTAQTPSRPAQAAPTRTSGGFSRPSSSAPSRTSGGFAGGKKGK